ncbi:Putative mitochondrial ribosomal protein L9A, imported to mitochondria [Ostreococcus lucimarinus CCE9901]|uniref:Large ribosomal subunit protein bL9c n=1 Tax=Ostreococcus lucimarinus (strain CCE9901) TaxID=436017 RepID=A4S7G3_OSTLU|nr:Putative mitochondrial ribosomal protein L9A, imported to mitochondria [Ostreococcus lucimarinus CCE9901]ABO99743.1 Putative mitochondrial ribosomal protein L9A, imported to mitochondria [Ostreococcus lucimarinus CCE9901]|eukprot:XP_001421450.1 Putative mitochondrial ribosomal protein L9A, imported to mitochondria [Ostreococcus lucimarinus CCE9901]
MPASMRVERRWWKKANRRVEVILRAPVSGLGDVDEVAHVRPGRARNHLVPGKLATYVNAEKLAAARERLAARERARIEAGGEDGDEAAATAQEEEHKRKERATVMKMLTAEPAIAFRRIKDKKTGKPRIAVTRENIVEEIRRQKSLNLTPGALMLERPIVDFGEYDIPLFIRGEPVGERTVPVVVRERL